MVFCVPQHSDDKDELIKNEELDPATPQAIAKKKKYLGKINYKVRYNSFENIGKNELQGKT
jgi:hypothetical protein